MSRPNFDSTYSSNGVLKNVLKNRLKVSMLYMRSPDTLDCVTTRHFLFGTPFTDVGATLDLDSGIRLDRPAVQIDTSLSHALPF